MMMDAIQEQESSSSIVTLPSSDKHGISSSSNNNSNNSNNSSSSNNSNNSNSNSSSNTTTTNNNNVIIMDSVQKHQSSILTMPASDSQEGCFDVGTHYLIEIIDCPTEGRRSFMSYTCKVCGKIFNRRSGLHRHTTVHSDQKCHVCEACGKSFKRKDALDSHMAVIHVKEKSFECEVCSRRFNRRNNLTRHMQSHNGARPFPCAFCEKAFARKNSLQVHMAKKHGSIGGSIYGSGGVCRSDKIDNRGQNKGALKKCLKAKDSSGSRDGISRANYNLGCVSVSSGSEEEAAARVEIFESDIGMNDKMLEDKERLLLEELNLLPVSSGGNDHYNRNDSNNKSSSNNNNLNNLVVVVSSSNTGSKKGRLEQQERATHRSGCKDGRFVEKLYIC